MFRRVSPIYGTALSPLGRRIPGFVTLACLLVFPMAGHSREAYLDAIQLEAEKLQDSATSGWDGAETRSASEADDPVAKFEHELETHYRGTYLFYKKLPAKSREEIFLEHEQGASIEEARKTIMNRYLHDR